MKCKVLAGPWEEQGGWWGKVQERTAQDSRVGCLLTWRAGMEGKSQPTANYETGLLSLELPLLPREKDHPSVHLRANLLNSTPCGSERGGKPDCMFNV